MFKGVNEGGKRQDVGIRRTKVRRSGGGEDLRGGLPAVRGAGGTGGAGGVPPIVTDNLAMQGHRARGGRLGCSRGPPLGL